jgi:hypothetical protein
LGFVGTDRREKHAAKAAQLGTPIAVFKSIDECFCLGYCLKGLRGAIR